MSAGVTWAGEVCGWDDGTRGFSCLAHLTGGPCRADVGLCDLCMMDLYLLLEAVVPALVPALDTAVERNEAAAAVRQGLDQVLLGAVGLLIEPVPDEGRAWELLSEYYPDVQTTLQLAERLSWNVHDTSADPAAAALAKQLRAVLVQADALLTRGWRR